MSDEGRNRTVLFFLVLATVTCIATFVCLFMGQGVAELPTMSVVFSVGAQLLMAGDGCPRASTEGAMSEPTKEQLAAWEEWLADRPPVIQDLARRFPPWAWFRLKDEPARLYVYHAVAFFEDGTLRMAKYSVATGEGIIQVFGIKPDDLEPCGSPDEEREGMGPAEEARGVVLASLERAIHDRRLAELEENPDAPPTTPMRALADYLTEATESAPWVLTNDDGEEIMRGTGLRFHEDGSFSVEETPPAPEPSEEP